MKKLDPLDVTRPCHDVQSAVLQEMSDAELLWAREPVELRVSHLAMKGSVCCVPAVNTLAGGLCVYIHTDDYISLCLELGSGLDENGLPDMVINQFFGLRVVVQPVI